LGAPQQQQKPAPQPRNPNPAALRPPANVGRSAAVLDTPFR
jgi:hypothetical protein